MLKFLYRTKIGRCILKPLTARRLSILAGKWMDHPSSKFLIKPFMNGNKINPDDYLAEEYHCFNDCFTRRIKPELRPIDQRADALIAPSDGYLRGFKITDNLVFPVKESFYNINSLLGDEKLAESFENGYCLVFRLCVNHYHRYCFPDNGILKKRYFIPGRLHTVQPIALESFPVFTENCREISILETENFGTIAQIEVGAMLVGRIKNHPIDKFTKGMEKGMFDYGGSTIILLVEKDRVRFPQMLFDSTNKGLELNIRQGQRIGKAIM